MARAICRCGQPLEVVANGSESTRVVCPRCGARVRVRNLGGSGAAIDAAGGGAAEVGDGFIRFSCPCGRRLKVSAELPPSHGKCPDCGAIVPVPQVAPGAAAPAAGRPPGDPETPTAELSPADLAALERWTRDHLARAADEGTASTTQLRSPVPAAPAPASPTSRSRVEAGLRVCPRCGKPVHLGAEACRECGTAVPRR